MAEERHICALRRQGCGGCPLLETPYPEQLRQKQAQVEALLGEFGPVSPILGMEHPWHYRNKAISTFCTGPGRRLDTQSFKNWIRQKPRLSLLSRMN